MTQILFESYRIQKSVTEFKKVLQNSKNYDLFVDFSTTRYTTTKVI